MRWRRSASALSKSARSRPARNRAIPDRDCSAFRSRARYRGILGINIGKNFDTPSERAAADYLVCMRKAYPLASYLAVNVSSPNTQNLRQLQQADALDRL